MLQFSHEYHLKRHKETMQAIMDELIIKILEEEHENRESTTFALIENIQDLQLMSNTLLKYVNKISDDELALHLIRTVVFHNRVHLVPEEQIERLRKYLSDIMLYADIGRAITITDFTYDTWTKVMEISHLAPERLLHSLIERNQYELCHQWIENVSLREAVIKPQFIDLFMCKIKEHRDSTHGPFIKVCKVLLKIMVLQMDSNLLLKLRNRKLLKYLVDFLLKNAHHDNYIYKNYKITLSIFDVISVEEAESLWDLVEMPLLIIEQYILNSKFETLSRILQTILPLLKSNECQICTSKNVIDMGGSAQFYRQIAGDTNPNRPSNINYASHASSVQCVDQILRTYAAKALDFHIGTGNLVDDSSSPNRAVSLDSLCGTFVMPREAPDKMNWVRDEETTHCMCCKRSLFTMLTRRHHCRRCGRVVCHTCSTKRLTIPKLYDNILVRFCDDCFRQTNEAEMAAENIARQSESVSPPPKVPALNEETHEQPIGSRNGWVFRFSGHLKHDSLLRDEFSFEYAPSASLCLNIISMHTPGQECCDFLLNYCKKFEALLKPLKPGLPNPEVDYAFVTRILYCLSFAAKVNVSLTRSTYIKSLV